MEINNLYDLNNLRTAPTLNQKKIKKLLKELEPKILNSDWITVGIMASNDNEAIEALRTISKKFSLIKFNGFENLKANGNVFLKGNQKTGSVYIRSENGLGKGILITCQYNQKSKESITYGPLPLDFFSN